MGQIYAATTTPPECTGDAIAMAIRAGCAVENLEFIQFHPTGLARSSENGRTFLISEAVRGEGGILTNQAGERFMPYYDRRAELAPRDIVARAIAAEIAKQTQDFVSLDISHQPAAFVRRHF
ncbi:FAD-binding protein, partial [Enterobacter hormaechei subsp. steigerwaltii]|nr:FAD-binding protein [Enterobacter hormaechei subsp. steigerwaltii]